MRRVQMMKMKLQNIEVHITETEHHLGESTLKQELIVLHPMYLFRWIFFFFCKFSPSYAGVRIIW